MKLYAISITSDAETVNRQKQQQIKEQNAKKKKNAEKAPAPQLGLYDNAVFKEFDLNELDNPYIDNFMSSNRLLAKKGMTKLPEDQIPPDAQKKPGMDLDPKSGETIVIAFSTNAKKRKLFAFIDIWIHS